MERDRIVEERNTARERLERIDIRSVTASLETKSFQSEDASGICKREVQLSFAGAHVKGLGEIMADSEAV